MPQSLSNVLVHVIYSTKNREPFLRNVALRRELEAYLVGTLQAIECPPLGLRVVADHLHAVCRLSRTVTIAKLVETMKTESSNWIKRHSRGTSSFQWQNGYAVFSVSASNAARVRATLKIRMSITAAKRSKTNCALSCVVTNSSSTSATCGTNGRWSETAGIVGFQPQRGEIL